MARTPKAAQAAPAAAEPTVPNTEAAEATGSAGGETSPPAATSGDWGRGDTPFLAEIAAGLQSGDAAAGVQVTTTLPPIENGFAAASQEASAAAPRTVLTGDTLESLCGRVLMVRSVSPAGFRRAGRGFTPEETPVEVDDLTPRQFDDLINESALVVTID